MKSAGAAEYEVTLRQVEGQRRALASAEQNRFLWPLRNRVPGTMAGIGELCRYERGATGAGRRCPNLNGRSVKC